MKKGSIWALGIFLFVVSAEAEAQYVYSLTWDFTGTVQKVIVTKGSTSSTFALQITNSEYGGCGQIKGSFTTDQLNTNHALQQLLELQIGRGTDVRVQCSNLSAGAVDGCPWSSTGCGIVSVTRR